MNIDDCEPCGACNGIGTVEKLSGATGNVMYGYQQCDVCKGLGFIRALQFKKTKPVGKASRL